MSIGPNGGMGLDLLSVVEATLSVLISRAKRLKNTNPSKERDAKLLA